MVWCVCVCSFFGGVGQGEEMGIFASHASVTKCYDRR